MLTSNSSSSSGFNELVFCKKVDFLDTWPNPIELALIEFDITVLLDSFPNIDANLLSRRFAAKQPNDASSGSPTAGLLNPADTMYVETMTALMTTSFNPFNPHNWQRAVEPKIKSEFEICKVTEVTVKYMKREVAGVKSLQEFRDAANISNFLSADAKTVPLAAVAMISKKAEDITTIMQGLKFSKNFDGLVTKDERYWLNDVPGSVFGLHS